MKRSSLFLAVLLAVSTPAFAEGNRLASNTPELPELTTTASQSIRNEIERKIMIEELIRLNWIARELQRPEPLSLDDVL
jgi:hypothetical protein